MSTNTRIFKMAQDWATSPEKGECLACGLNVDTFQVKGPLNVLKASGESGCARCKLLTLSAELFSTHWTLDDQDDPIITLSRPYSGGKALQICLEWPSVRRGKYLALWLDVSGEVRDTLRELRTSLIVLHRKMGISLSRNSGSDGIFQQIQGVKSASSSSHLVSILAITTAFAITRDFTGPWTD